MGFSVRSQVLVVLALALQNAAGAQRLATAPIDSGTVIRMHVANAAAVRGRLLRTFTPSSSTLTFCRYPGAPCANLSDQHVDSLPASQVTRLELAHSNHLLKGALIGGAAAAPIGWLWWQFAGICDESACVTRVHRGAVGIVAFGIALGMLFGSQSVGWRAAL